MQGTYEFEYAVLPHAGNWEAGGVLHEAEKFNIDPVVAVAGPGEGELPQELSFIELEGDGLVLNAVKKGEWDDSLILRVSNPTSRPAKGAIRLRGPFAKAEAVNMKETEVEQKLAYEQGRILVTLQPKKVLTVRIGLAASTVENRPG